MNRQQTLFGAVFFAPAIPGVAAAETVKASSPQLVAQPPGTPAGTIMTKEYVGLVGRLAYLWGWPLVNNYNRALAVSKLPEPGRIGGVVPGAPAGRISMLTDYIDAAEHFVTCPNHDTVYGAGYQRLDVTPVVVQVPDFGGRFYTYQIADARTDSFGKIGKQYGTKPGFYLVVGPDWNGDAPAGITGVLRSSTNLVAIFPRIFMDDTPEDKRAIQPLLSQVMVYPVAEFDGKMKAKDWSKTPSFPAPAGGSGETRWVVPEKFFDELRIAMKDIAPLPGEQALYGMINSVVEAAAVNPEVKAALQESAIDAESELIKPLFEFRNNGRPLGNG
jgi:hypothetical protein